jgi:predicted metalloprotease with PDZ domain
LPLPSLLDAAGIAQRHSPAGLAAALGLRLSEGALSGVQVKSVLAGSAAAEAGVSAGDELLAANGWRIRRLDDAQQWLATSQDFELLLVRDQRVLKLNVQPIAAPVNTLALALADKPAAAAASLRRGWLGV